MVEMMVLTKDEKRVVMKAGMLAEKKAETMVLKKVAKMADKMVVY